MLFRSSLCVAVFSLFVCRGGRGGGWLVRVAPHSTSRASPDPFLSSLLTPNPQDFCEPQPPFPPANSSRLGLASPGPLFVPLPNTTALGWAANVTAPPAWPPLSSLRLLASQEGQSCVEACRGDGLVCEPAHFRFVNNKEALRG